MFVVIFALLDTDRDCESEFGYGSRDPIEYGSNPDPDTDPDPQHWLQMSALMLTLGKGLSPDRLQVPETVERTVLFRKRLKSKKEL